MKRFNQIALTLTLALSTSAYAGNYDSYFDRIQTASWHGDMSGLDQLQHELDAVAANGDPEAEYVAAYADYRLAAAGQKDVKKNEAVIAAALDRAETRLETLSHRESSYKAESLALLSGVYGLKISLSPTKGMTLGTKAGTAIKQAEQLAPNNPRVQLFAGENKLFTPPLFGGNREQAIDAFNSAINHLPSISASAVNWGLADAYIWRGITQKAAGHVEDARASYEQALNVAPEYNWAKVLLAAVDK